MSIIIKIFRHETFLTLLKNENKTEAGHFITLKIFIILDFVEHVSSGLGFTTTRANKRIKVTRGTHPWAVGP